MNSVRSTTYHCVKFRYDHTTRVSRNAYFKGEQRIYDQLYHMRQFLHIMMTDIKSNII